MSKSEHASSWSQTIRTASLKNPTLVAADADSNLYGFICAGPARDRSLPYEAEVFTLYVAPGHTGQGIGAALLNSVFRLFSKANYGGMIIWALADNPSRFFYEVMGGRIVAERQHPLWGSSYREIAYGWDALEIGKARQSVSRNEEPDPTRD
jgi:GNAT superfamily N-acetyltransferase